MYRLMTPTGLGALFVPPLEKATQDTLTGVQAALHKIGVSVRNQIILARYKAGETLSNLARAFEISPQRVYQIVNATME